MSRPRTRISDGEHRIRQQRTPRSVAEAWPKDATGYHAPPQPSQPVTHHTSSDGIGRVPVIGLDSGHIPGTRPDQSSINQR